MPMTSDRHHAPLTRTRGALRGGGKARTPLLPAPGDDDALRDRFRDGTTALVAATGGGAWMLLVVRVKN